MSTDAAQVMRVVDRCLDTARLSSDTVPEVAAAAARATADPQMRQAIAILLAATATTTWTCWQRAMTAARQASAAGSLEFGYSCPGNHGTAESGHYAFLAGECDEATSLAQIFTSCKAASQSIGATDSRTPAALAELFLSAVAVERSSLGTDRSRRLRNLTSHGDIQAAIRRSGRLTGHQVTTRE